MKTKPFIFILGASLLLISFIVTGISNYHRQSEAKKAAQALATLPASRMFDALEAYRRTQGAEHPILPETVSLGALLSGGYLQTNEVAALAGMSVIFSTTDHVDPAARGPHERIEVRRITAVCRV